MNIPKVRQGSTVRMSVSLTDNGVKVDWRSLDSLSALIYSDSQRAIAGAASIEIDKADTTSLLIEYAGYQPQYDGLARLIIRCLYKGAEKTFDAPVCDFVSTTAEATGITVINDPELDVHLTVNEVSTSVLDAAIAAAFDGASKANTAAQAATEAASGVIAATDNANEAASLARDAAQSVEAVKTAAQDATKAANNAAELATKAANETTEKLSSIIVQELGSDETKTVSQKTITSALQTKQNTLIPGNGISIEGNVISATVGGGEDSPIDLSSYAKKADVDSALELKVDKVTGKGLSSNDYTDADKLKLAGLENYDDTQIRELIAGKANLQHRHTVADITDFPELYYDATAFLTSGAYPSDKYNELLESVKAKKTIYATIDEEGYVSYVFFMSSANNDGSSSRVLLTTIFADGSNLYLNTFVLQQSGKTALQENITGKAHKATTLAGYGIGDAYTKSEVDTAIERKQDKTLIVTETEGSASYAISPNVLTKLGTLASSVTLSLDTSKEESGVTNVYDIIFVTPANAPSITWPEGISWVGGSAPAIAGGKTYEVSIMDNLATYGEF